MARPKNPKKTRPSRRVANKTNKAARVTGATRATRANTNAHRAGRLPLSGSEPLFSEFEYGTRGGRGNNNCYAYALGHYRVQGGVKLQPGNMSRQSSNRNASSCAFLTDRALDDSRGRGIYRADPTAPCRRGFYKIMSFIDPGVDYHWYVQNGSLLYRVRPQDVRGSGADTRAAIATLFGVPTAAVVSRGQDLRAGNLVLVKGAGVWSHKQGLATGPLLFDAAGKVIRDPRRANRNYGEYNYRKSCGAFCVRDIPGAMSSQPSPLEAPYLHALLDKRAGLVGARPKNSRNRVGRRAKVQGRNAR